MVLFPDRWPNYRQNTGVQPFESKVYLAVFGMYFVVSILQAARMAWGFTTRRLTLVQISHLEGECCKQEGALAKMFNRAEQNCPSRSVGLHFGVSSQLKG